MTRYNTDPPVFKVPHHRLIFSTPLKKRSDEQEQALPTSPCSSNYGSDGLDIDHDDEDIIDSIFASISKRRKIGDTAEEETTFLDNTLDIHKLQALSQELFNNLETEITAVAQSIQFNHTSGNNSTTLETLSGDNSFGSQTRDSTNNATQSQHSDWETIKSTPHTEYDALDGNEELDSDHLQDFKQWLHDTKKATSYGRILMIHCNFSRSLLSPFTLRQHDMSTYILSG